jgi:hypothetical protein
MAQFINTLLGGLTVLVGVGCSAVRSQPTSSGKVLLAVSDDAIKKVAGRLGITNAVCHSPGRDAQGNNVLLALWSRGTGPSEACLISMSAESNAVTPWAAAAKQVPEDPGRGTFQSPPHNAFDLRWKAPLPDGYRVESVSANWIAVSAPNRRPWLAHFATPTEVKVELPELTKEVSIWANGNRVHVFTRKGWRYEDGPLRYRAYDLQGSTPRVLKELVLPWARGALDMDPEAELVVLKSNHRAYARDWLFDLKTGKSSLARVWPSMVHLLFVKRPVATAWQTASQ